MLGSNTIGGLSQVLGAGTIDGTSQGTIGGNIGGASGLIGGAGITNSNIGGYPTTGIGGIQGYQGGVVGGDTHQHPRQVEHMVVMSYNQLFMI